MGNVKESKMGNVIIVNPEKLKELKDKFVEGGPGKIHVVADFDNTLTYNSVDGGKVPSIISILRDGSYLTSDYAPKAHTLYEKYHPFENDVRFPLEERKKKMEEWWKAHLELLLRSGLERKDIEGVVESGKLKLREGAEEFFKALRENNIPLVIISSSGLGKDAIEIFLRNRNLLTENVHVVSNAFSWDENGKAIDYKKPIIHSLNKDETVLRNFPFFERIAPRKNVLLLGDSLGDAKMAEGFKYEALLKICFAGKKAEKNLEEYKKSFDIVIMEDPGMDYVNNLLEEIAKISKIDKVSTLERK